MECEINLTTNPDLSNAIYQCAPVPYIRERAIITWAVLTMIVCDVMFSGKVNDIYQFMARVIPYTISIALVWIVVYYTMLRGSNNCYKLMPSKTLFYRMTDAELRVISDLGRYEISWNRLLKLQRYPELWLLYFGESDFVFIPVSAMNEEFSQFILQKAEQQGVKVI